MGIKELPDGVSKGDLKKLQKGKETIVTMRHDDKADLGDKRIVDRVSFEDRIQEKKKLKGFSVREYETAILLQGGRFIGAVPSGLWEISKNLQVPGTEIIWVNNTDFKIRWGVGNIFTKNMVKVGAHGEMILKVADAQNFVMNLVAQSKKVERDQIEDFLLSHVTSILKNHFHDYDMEGLIKERDRFITVARAKLQETFSQWGLKLVNLEVMGWNFPPEFEQMAQDAWQMKVSAHQVEMQKTQLGHQTDLTKAQLAAQAELAAAKAEAQKSQIAAQTDLEKTKISAQSEVDEVAFGATVDATKRDGALRNISQSQEFDLEADRVKWERQKASASREDMILDAKTGAAVRDLSTGPSDFAFETEQKRLEMERKRRQMEREERLAEAETQVKVNSIQTGQPVTGTAPAGETELQALEKKLDDLEERFTSGEISEETFILLAKRTQDKIDALKNK